MATYPLLEHRAGRAAGWLRDHRFQLALILAVVETTLVVTNVVQWRWAVVVAGLVFAFHFAVGRRARYEAVREVSWAAAVSQTLPVVVPVVGAAALALAVLAIVAVAFVVLALFLVGRR